MNNRNNRQGESDWNPSPLFASFGKGPLYLIPPPSGLGVGPLLPPQNRIGVIMGNSIERQRVPIDQQQPSEVPAGAQRPRSNLTALLQQHDPVTDTQATSRDSARVGYDASGHVNDAGLETRHIHLARQLSEADSASGPAPSIFTSASGSQMAGGLVHSAPAGIPVNARLAPPPFLPLSAESSTNGHSRRSSSGDMLLLAKQQRDRMYSSSHLTDSKTKAVRRCISSKELGTLAPPSGSPYAFMLYQKEVLEATMQHRLMALRESASPLDRSLTPSPALDNSDEGDSSRRSLNAGRLTNETRNRRRAEHNRAVTNDLCEIVTDLFVAESKLLNPSIYGVQSSVQREEVLRSVHQFVSALPPRYALGADTPSEVLVHMRLMAAVRSNKTRAVVHIVNLEDNKAAVSSFHRGSSRCLHLVTISCADADGLLEYITRLLATGGSRVIDADVMMSADSIVLDRFVVEMHGRLRLDKLANYIEAFLAQSWENKPPSPEDPLPDRSPGISPGTEPSGPLYFHPPNQKSEASPREIQAEIQSAVPLSVVLASPDSSGALAQSIPSRRSIIKLRRENSMPNPPIQSIVRSPDVAISRVSPADHACRIPTAPETTNDVSCLSNATSLRPKRPLVNREATIFGDYGLEEGVSLEYLTANPATVNLSIDAFAGIEDRMIPLIPFEELMLIETLGMGRVSTIYRAAWQRSCAGSALLSPMGVEMVALKVATVNPETGDASHVDELRREADIAALLQHPNVCDLVGVAADAECFCLAYEFCEGGSLLALLSDASRYYEYLPIALDIANGMAYLHHRNVIHRDLKPSNVLLTRDHRAKISDFGMSVANTGQELTAETGTYRYMAPEVIRHESYSSNADVYSFGIVLWQLITREVPFATMTPIQAAFAVAEGRRPEMAPSTPARLQAIITACWDQDSHKRPSFTYIAMALADYARMAFSPANVGAQTLQIANEMLANVEGNSTVNVDFSTPVARTGPSVSGELRTTRFLNQISGSYNSNVGLEI